MSHERNFDTAKSLFKEKLPVVIAILEKAKPTLKGKSLICSETILNWSSGNPLPYDL